MSVVDTNDVRYTSTVAHSDATPRLRNLVRPRPIFASQLTDQATSQETGNSGESHCSMSQPVAKIEDVEVKG